ncbi:MAG: hypothetical protein GWP14_02510 [Actinobacteria bacterium]|nr:hypothetical protein [Actinomycetota bacterium]
MHLKFDTIQGWLIYVAMLSFLLAFAGLLGKSKKPGRALYAVGFVLSVVAFVYRWYHVGHVPLQNLFEVFLCLGMLIYPLSIFGERFLGVRAGAIDALIGFIILFPAGFVFNAEPQRLPPALQSWLFAPHVAAYMLAYVVMAKASIQAVGQLLYQGQGEGGGYELGTYRMVCLGFPLLSLGLILGSWWGKIAWGDYWNWDPKELWSLVSWLVYLGYFHFRYIFGKKRPRINSLIVLGGFLAIIITLLWANLARVFAGLHSYVS